MTALATLALRQRAMQQGRLDWRDFADLAAESLDLPDALDLLELAMAALSGHADQRSDVEALVGPAFNRIEDLIGSLRRLPPGHEYRLAQARADAADLRRRMAREMVDA